MFAYCGNNPVNASDESGEFFLILGAVCAGVSFVSTLVTGGDVGDAFIEAGISFVTTGFGVSRLACAGIATAKAWIIDGQSFSDGIKSGAITYAVSFASGADILGDGASEGVSALIDGTFGFAGNVLGDVVENTIQINKTPRQSYLEHLMLTNTQGYYSWVNGGGGRKGITNAVEIS